jgi:hypothetical protein
MICLGSISGSPKKGRIRTYDLRASYICTEPRLRKRVLSRMKKTDVVDVVVVNVVNSVTWAEG